MRFIFLSFFLFFLSVRGAGAADFSKFGLILDVYDNGESSLWEVSRHPDVLRTGLWSWMPVSPSGKDDSYIRDWKWTDDDEVECPDSCDSIRTLLARYRVDRIVVRRNSDRGVQIFLVDRFGVFARQNFSFDEDYGAWISQTVDDVQDRDQGAEVLKEEPAETGSGQAESVVASPGD